MRSRTVARLYPNGLDPETGEYLLPPLDLCGCERIQPALAIRGGPISGVEESRLECAGWAVVFAEDASEDVRRALEPLLALRRGQVGPSERFQLFEGDRAFRRGESKRAWQERIGFGDGPADPDQLPCHLLLVGDPVAIPFEAQFELGIQRSVGRLWFDRPCEFRSYAERVVQAEGRTASERRELALFATANPRDCATEMACEDLMEPLARSLSQAPLGWQLRAFTREAATKERLAALLSGQVPLSLLVTTSHGLGPGAGRPPGEVGALVCQDWPGPGSGPLEPRQVFTAADLRATRADLSGLICYHFGCFSGGLPAEDGFALPGQARQRLAECPRLASLPQA
ncbi:MAG TPA: hypothetical protein PK413_20540, partial [Thermoanaerobaculia bacterium]|nr:hypothetical protein [Thermoanaerobaculia bacterium]